MGVLSTLVYDFGTKLGVGVDSQAEMFTFYIALIFRIFTYIALFYTCRLLVEKLSANQQRTIELAVVWSIVGSVLAALTWWQLASGGEVYNSPSTKRFTPETLAAFAPGWSMAEVALGKDGATYYSWMSAIGLEIVGIFAISFSVAFFLRSRANKEKYRGAYFASFIAYIVMLIYSILVPWSFIWGVDFFIGDALIGPMIFNAQFFFNTIIYGGFAAPAIWVNLIGIANLFLLNAWRIDQPVPHQS